MRTSNNEEILSSLAEIKRQLAEINKRLDNLEHSTNTTKKIVEKQIKDAQVHYEDIIDSIENT